MKMGSPVPTVHISRSKDVLAERRMLKISFAGGKQSLVAQSVEKDFPVALIPVKRYVIEGTGVTSLAYNLVVNQNHVDIHAPTPVMHHSNAQKLHHVNPSYAFHVPVVVLSKRSGVTPQSHLRGAK